MATFKGEYRHSVDDKGRVNIPAPFRNSLPQEANGTFVVTRGLDGCLSVYSKDVWKRVEEYLRNLPLKARRYVRVLTSQAWETKLDEQGRITIPKRLLSKAEIENRVVIIGVLDKIELWRPDKFERYMQQDEETLKEVAEGLRL